LINSGDINIISNDTLKYLLISWKDVLEDYQEEEVFGRQIWIEEFNLMLLRMVILKIIQLLKTLNCLEIQYL